MSRGNFQRTLTFTNVEALNAESGELVFQKEFLGTTTKKRVLRDFYKITEEEEIVPVIVNLIETKVTREISIEDFLQHSTVVEPIEEEETF